jgi:hypothetical protein
MIRSSIDRVILAALGGASVCGAISACNATGTEPETSGTDSNSTSGSASGGAGAGSVPPGAGSAAVAGSAGTVTPSGGAGAGSGAAGAAMGGAGAIVPLCTTKVTMQSPTIASFETYDGTTAPVDFSWVFGGATDGMLGVHTSTYAYGDGSVTPVLSILAGHGGNYGLTVSVTNASKWGEGFGLYLLDEQYKPACIDASAYKGVTMWVRGVVPTGTFSFTLAMSQAIAPSTTGPGGSCTGIDDTTCKAPTASGLPISETWTQVDVLWADLLGGLSGPDLPLVANGDNITGFSFGANLIFMPESEGSMVYVPVPGDISVVVDDIAFIP